MKKTLAIAFAAVFIFTAGCGDARPVASPAPDKLAHKTPTSPDKSQPVSTNSPLAAAPLERLPSAPPADSSEAAKWVSQLADADSETKERASQALSDAGSAAVGPLLAGLKDKSPERRRAVAYFLLDSFPSSDERIAAAWRDALADEDRKVRQLALQAVKRMPPETMALAVPRIADLLDSAREEPINRADAARLLGKLQAEARDALPALIRTAAVDPSEKVRAPALYSITRIAEPSQAQPVLVQSLGHDKDAGVRLVAATGLGRLGAAAAPAAGALAAALEDRDVKVRQACSESLAELQTAAILPLVGKLDSTNPRTRELAIFTLSRLGPAAKPALKEIEKRISDDDAAVRTLAQAVVESLRGM